MGFQRSVRLSASSSGCYVARGIRNKMHLPEIVCYTKRSYQTTQKLSLSSYQEEHYRFRSSYPVREDCRGKLHQGNWDFARRPGWNHHVKQESASIEPMQEQHGQETVWAVEKKAKPVNNSSTPASVYNVVCNDDIIGLFLETEHLQLKIMWR